TRLVSCLDARAQRLDVAKTIYYRRRAGTLGVLEELAADIAGRDARAVEFFRRLGRTRHQFDPPIGNAFAADVAAWASDTTYAPGQLVTNGANAYQCAAGGISAGSGGPTGTGTTILDGSVTWSFYEPTGSLVPAVIEGLAGANSHTPAGGFADLRNAYAAANSSGAFDEFAHTADLRQGAQSSGWYNISHLGVFIWWLYSFQIQAATPVSNGKNPSCFSFDPSGRQIQLFAPSSRTSLSFGEDWVSPNEWQLPVAVRDTLWNAYPDQLYPAAFWVGLGGGGAPAPMSRDAVMIHPDRGVFSFTAAPPQGQIVATYHFGFMSMIGAGGFSDSLLEPITAPTAVTTVSGGGGLATALGGVTTDATVQITDSLTYPGFTAPVTLPDATLVLTVTDQQRPVVRWAGGGASWTITGTGGDLVLEGIWLQGADIVLAGSFQTVSLRLATLDPGSSDPTGPLIGTAIDGMPLAPVHLWVEASIETLTVERCITGPIRTRNGGAIEQLTASDSIIQGITTPAGGDYALQTTIGTISLARCTVLGRCAVHRLEASECVLDDAAIAEDTQHGCVRFTAYAQGSALHAPYRSVAVPAVGPVFVSRRFGEPGYARLRRLADAAIIDPQTGDTILGGAQNESEMGAFCGEQVSLKKRGLTIKFEEYAPLGIFPVWIDAD
ncbi:MAG TPA: hypothetical protein VMU42_16115, partial [Candidatus Sulfotelmatobacter sp.]|nr:hypothetical protein [Candidatus Sulfotelmatobacter sp.]